jgi:hypothetical protein
MSFRSLPFIDRRQGTMEKSSLARLWSDLPLEWEILFSSSMNN